MDVQAKSDCPENESLLDACVSAARTAADIIARGASRLPSIRWETKKGSDFVSDVDRSAEEAIRGVLLERFPSAAIVGEELSPSGAAGADLAFVVDPLDGTTNFLHGYPEYAVSIAALCGGELRAGVVFNAASGEKFTATAGGGAFLGGKRIRVSDITDPARALIGTGFPFKRHELLPQYLPQFDAVMRSTSGIRRAGSAAIDLSAVACGRFDGFWELDLAPWDVAAGILLVREAGGLVTDLAGNPAEINFGPFVAGNPVIHEWLLETLRHAASPGS
jgi:myo-inositol-1(or 4)-monophosphatase